MEKLLVFLKTKKNNLSEGVYLFFYEDLKLDLRGFNYHLLLLLH